MSMSIKLQCRPELLQQWQADVMKNPQAFASLLALSPEYVAMLVNDAVAAAWLQEQLKTAEERALAAEFTRGCGIGLSMVAPAQSSDWRAMVYAPLDGTEVELLLQHLNFRYAEGEKKKEWEQVVRAKWIDFNGGGWTWRGMYGTPMGWRPIDMPQPAQHTACRLCQRVTETVSWRCSGQCGPAGEGVQP